MKHRNWPAAAALAAVLLPGFATAAETGPMRMILVGDSTLAPRTGYGDALCRRLPPQATCLNLARGGRSSGSFRAEGLWDAMLDRLREPAAGASVVLIQFGHNDQPGKPGRSTDLVSEFPANMARFVDEVKAAGALPVLLTPLTRRSFHDKVLNNDLQAWAEATRSVAAAKQVPLLDLNALSAAAVQAMGPDAADTLAEAPPGQPRFDHTHLGSKGACVFSQMVARELVRLLPAPAEWFDTAGSCP